MHHMADLEAQEFVPTLAADPSLWPQIVVGPRFSRNKKKLGKNGDGSCSPGTPKAWENWIFCRDDLRDDLRDYRLLSDYLKDDLRDDLRDY